MVLRLTGTEAEERGIDVLEGEMMVGVGFLNGVMSMSSRLSPLKSCVKYRASQ